MRLLVVLLLLVPAAAALAPAPAAVFAFGEVHGRCGGEATFRMDPLTRSGEIVSAGTACFHSTGYSGELCVDDQFCGGECTLAVDGVVECWYGTPTVDPLAPTYVRLDADGTLLWTQWGTLQASGHLTRIG